MRSWWLRRSLAGRAAEAGFGSVRRVHYERRRWIAPLILEFDGALTVLLQVGVVLTGFLIFLAAIPGIWPVVVLVSVVGAWAGWVLWVPIPGGRWWYAVCDGGLLVGLRLGLRRSAPTAIAWDTVEGLAPVLGIYSRNPVLQLIWLDDTVERSLTFSTVTARGDLIAAIDRRKPVPTPTARRIAVSAGAMGVAAILVWVVLIPRLADTIMGERPDSLGDFARLCASPGAAYGRAASYRTRGPHPVVLFAKGEGVPVVTTTGKGSREPGPNEVQLVACSRLVQRLNETTCPYTGGFSITYHQGRYRVDIYEARTGRKVGSRTVSSDFSTSCSSMVWRYEDSADHEEQDISPSVEAYKTLLQPLAAGSRS